MHGKMKSICFIHQKFAEKVMFCGCVMSSVICTLIVHTQEPIKLLHLYELLYNSKYNNSNNKL